MGRSRKVGHTMVSVPGHLVRPMRLWALAEGTSMARLVERELSAALHQAQRKNPALGEALAALEELQANAEGAKDGET